MKIYNIWCVTVATNVLKNVFLSNKAMTTIGIKEGWFYFSGDEILFSVLAMKFSATTQTISKNIIPLFKISILQANKP